MRTELGRISKVYMGFTGYQDLMFGLGLTIEGKAFSVFTSICGGWTTEVGEFTKWTEQDRLLAHGKACVEVTEIMKKAKVSCVDELKNKPVECTFYGNLLKSWRILEEVL